ncbi:MAG: hypothetical protein ABI744_07125 [Chloroflexota bacterium]
MAIDRGQLVDLRGGPSAASVTCQVLPPGWPAYEPYCPYTTHPDPGGRWQAPNLDAARELIDRSGTRGTKVIVGPSVGTLADVRDYVVTVLQELGFDASADTNTDFDYVLQASCCPDSPIQINVWEWFSGKLSPGDFLGPLRCGRNDGTTNFCDLDYDALVAQATNLQATDVAASLDEWAQADRKVVDLALWAPLFNEGSDFVSSRVGNYQFHLYYGALLDQMWIQ